MRLSPSVVFAGTALVAGWLAGCSRPSNGTDAATKPTRDVSLVEPAALEAPLVSALEAGRPLKAISQIRQPAPAVKPEIDPTAVVALEHAPTVSTAAATVSELVQAPMPAPAVEEPTVLVGRGLEPSYGGGGPSFVPEPSYVGRRPGIIIRGGRGGIDDDCDIHRPGMRRFPVAVNQVAPPRMSFPRGGIR